MSFSILGGLSFRNTKGKTDYTQRSKEQLNNGKIHAVHTEEKAEKLGIETEGKEQITLEKEIHETEVGREAEQLGISIEGKDVGTLSEEIYETKSKARSVKARYIYREYINCRFNYSN